VLGVETVAWEKTGAYGIVRAGQNENGYQQISSIVEKPHPSVAPSNLAVVGRYILTPAIFTMLRAVGPGAGGEIQLTDGIADLLKDEPVLAQTLHGTRYDCGSKLGYLKATLAYGMKHPEVGGEFIDYLQRLRA
jgi:UTP--glucose-1-phosphate uridylyltransferase